MKRVTDHNRSVECISYLQYSMQILIPPVADNRVPRVCSGFLQRTRDVHQGETQGKNYCVRCTLQECAGIYCEQRARPAKQEGRFLRESAGTYGTYIRRNVRNQLLDGRSCLRSLLQVTCVGRFPSSKNGPTTKLRYCGPKCNQ